MKSDPMRDTNGRTAAARTVEQRSDPTPRPDAEARPTPRPNPTDPPAWGLIRLLNAFKAARIRRDESAYGSGAWDEADGELQVLQREIFELSFDDRTPDRRPGRTRHDTPDTPGSTAGAADPDEELGLPDGPAAI